MLRYILFVLFLANLLSCTGSKLGTDAANWLPQKMPSREPMAAAPTKTSFYLPMPDGVKIATDLYLPSGYAAPAKLPTILLQTRYYRAFDIRWPASLFTERFGPTIKAFTANGYAVVTTDTRGSGASFGSIDAPWSPSEVRDGSEVVHWITLQPWSNGKVGSLGTSYDGTSADMLLASGHPALKAIAPRFSLFDCYTDVAFPGGIHFKWFTKNWGIGNRALDLGRPGDALGFLAGLVIKGPKPVDEDASKKLLSAAQKEHEDNHDVFKDMLGITYREDRNERGFGFADVCPFGFVRELEATKVPIYSYSGWFDGAYPNAAIARFLSVKNPGSKLILGPWDHGGRQNISPFSSGRGPAFDHYGELLRFFDRYLKGEATGVDKELPVRYFTMGEEKWKSAPSWPPPGGKKVSLYLGEKRAVTFTPPTATDAASQDSYQVSYDLGTGDNARWNSIYNNDKKPILYPDRRRADEKLLVYDSPTLSGDLEVTGNPIAQIYLSSSDRDGEVFVYLEDLFPDGRVQYVTEGLLRALHRKESADAPMYQNAAGINRTFSRDDGQNLTPGKVAELRFELIATSYQFKKGHRIRIAIAGADTDHFSVVPPKPPIFKVQHSKQYPSRIELPVYGLTP